MGGGYGMPETEIDEHPKRSFKSPIGRERLVELAVVVFGILIALGVDSLAQEARLRGDARELEKAFQADIGAAVALSWERQLVGACLRQHLATLADRVAAPGPHEAMQALNLSDGSFDFALPQLYRAPTRLWTTASFDRAMGAEAFKRIPQERADAYVVLFALIANRREANLAEFYAGAGLAPLAYAQLDMNAEVRSDLLQQIAVLDRHQSLSLLTAGQIIEAAFAIPGTQDMHRAIVESRPHLEKWADEAKTNYGACVDDGAVDRLIALAEAEPTT